MQIANKICKIIKSDYNICMKSKPQESDFDGVYRWENMPIDTLAKIDKKTGDGFMLNKPLYGDMIDGLSQEEKKKIKQVIFDVLDEKIDKDIFKKTHIKNGKLILWQKNYSKILDDDKVKIKLKGKNRIWNAHDRLWHIYINNKKYFIKNISNSAYSIILWEKVRLKWSLEYKWLEYIDNYFEYSDDINIIKPVIVLDKWEDHLIIYPFVKWLVNWLELKKSHPELHSKLSQKYDSIFKKILSEWIVWDIKPANVFVDIKTEKIYIFDPVYNELWENLQSLEDKKIIFWLLRSSLIDKLRIQWSVAYKIYNWRTLAFDNFDNDMLNLFVKWIKKYRISIYNIIRKLKHKLNKAKIQKVKQNFDLETDFDPTSWEINIFTSLEEKHSAIDNYSKQIKLLQDFHKMINFKNK